MKKNGLLHYKTVFYWAHAGKLSASYLLLVDGDPVRGREPLVALDVVDPVLEVSVPLGQVDLEEVPEEVLQVAREVRGEADLDKKTHKLIIDITGKERQLATGKWSIFNVFFLTRSRENFREKVEMNKRRLLPPEAPTNRLRLIMKRGAFFHLSHIPLSLAFPRSAVCLSSPPSSSHPFSPKKKEKEKKSRTGNRYIPARPHSTPSPYLLHLRPFSLGCPVQPEKR